ncbi:hypothetical protein A0H81_07537 [Grifola frondosa]|uniref:Uncharacterized protein n=1 Tax=Grifola frondosa TaxID=5627 RepID=A0A1C7M807_GRIFR|nr:hypothetical protein A0H81_07537 [Grifola frondosa]
MTSCLARQLCANLTESAGRSSFVLYLRASPIYYTQIVFLDSFRSRILSRISRFFRRSKAVKTCLDYHNTSTDPVHSFGTTLLAVRSSSSLRPCKTEVCLVLRMAGADEPSRVAKTLFTFNSAKDMKNFDIGCDADKWGLRPPTSTLTSPVFCL